MPLSHVTKSYAIKDCKVAKMTADPAGGATTYAAAVDVPGVVSISLTQAMANKLLKGDNTLLDADVTVSEPWTGKLNFAKLSFDVESILFGTTVTDAGVTPNQTVTQVQYGGTAAAPSVPNYFRLEGIAAGADLIAGDLHLTFWKCKISGGVAGFAEEDYMKADFDVIAIPRLSDGSWMTKVINETAAAAAA